MVKVNLSPRRHDVMIVDPIQNILVDRESGEPLMIDFGRGQAPEIAMTGQKALGANILMVNP